MNILIIDRDTISTQLMRSRLSTLGHTVMDDPIKNTAIERLKKERYPVVFIDPLPLTNARPIISTVRRSVDYYPYVVLLSQEIDVEEALKAGANTLVTKPVAPSMLEQVLDDADTLNALIARFGDERENFPSAGGVIAKSAFNQLFLSAIDRADRYAEKSFLFFIRIDNYNDILAMDGLQVALYSAAKLSQALVRLRRQSDIIAQIGKSEYCLLLQRPRYENEAVDAAKRFADALGQLEGLTENETTELRIIVELVGIPSGAKSAHYELTLGKHGLLAHSG